MKKSKFSESQIIGILKEEEARIPAPQLCHEHGISSATFCKWRSKCVSMMKYVKELEEKNRCLKKMYTEELLKSVIVQKALAKNGKAIATQGDSRTGVQTKEVTIRLACQAFKVSEGCCRNEAKLSDENALIADWLLRLTFTNRKWGFAFAFCTCVTSRGSAGTTNVFA